MKALEYNKNHAKALQQLGWLHYKDEDDFRSAIEYLKRASEIGERRASRPAICALKIATDPLFVGVGFSVSVGSLAIIGDERTV